MNTLNVITHVAPGWIDTHIEQPAIGSRVQCLTIGNVQVSTVWNSESIKYADCWMPHQKVPKSVKARQLARMYGGNV